MYGAAGATAPFPQSIDEVNKLHEKMQVDACRNQDATNSRAYSMSEEAEKSAAFHYEQWQKKSEAANFLRAHPEFEHFMVLIRSGAIQF